MNKEINIMNKELLDNKSILSLISISKINSDYEEKIEDINKEFIDSTEINDFISKKGKIINPELNEYINLDSSLNSKNNPFIIESKII